MTPFCFACFLQRTVINHIHDADSLSERKERIMLAYQHGHLSARDAEDWIALGGMDEA